VTCSVEGLIPLLLLPRVKLELIENSGTVGYSVSTALKALKCDSVHALKNIGSGLANGPPNAARLATKLP
jgi:hypothetical protein